MRHITVVIRRETINVTTRDESMDIAKGIGIICVILAHCGIGRINTFYMIFFFVLSGYFMTSKYPIEKYIRKRAKQLLVPYCLGVLLTMLGAIIKDISFGRYGEIVNTLFKWLFAGLYGKGSKGEFLIDGISKIGAYWFFLAMFIGSVIARYYLENRFFLIILSVIAYVGYSTRQIVFLPWSIQNGMVASLFIGLGVMAKKYDIFNKKINRLEFISIIMCWIFGIYFSVTHSMVNLRFPYGFLNIIVGISGTYGFVIFSRKLRGVIGRFLGFMGKNSLIILFFHAFEINIFRWGWILIFLNNSIAAKIAEICLRILFSFLCTCIVVNTKIGKRIFGIGG